MRILSKSIVLALTYLCLIISGIRAQNIARIEYFIDNDPGFGKGISVTNFSAGPEISTSIEIPVATLSSGFHTIYVRALTTPYQVTEGTSIVTKGGWSLTHVRSFYKDQILVDNNEASNVVEYEYFFDNDPGFGSGIRKLVSANQAMFDLSLAIDVNSLLIGFHSLYIRFKDAKGNWGLTSVRNFYKDNPPSSGVQSAHVNKGEHFFDNDPGFGRASNINFVGGRDVSNIVFNPNIDTLAPGFHTLYARFQDANSKWGLTSVRSFFKEKLPTINDNLTEIIQGEYFVGSDPGFGKGTSIPLVPGQNITDLFFEVGLEKFEPGFYPLYLRFKDAFGSWGQSNVHYFYKIAALQTEPLSNVVAAEYFIDADPGFGKAKMVAVSPGIDINNLVFQLDMPDLSVGNHRIYVRAEDSKGHWSLTNIGSFKIEPPSELFVTIQTIQERFCVGGSIAIPFKVNAPFANDNNFIAQLSNSVGNFDTPIQIGMLKGSTSDTIRGLLPANTQAGSGYRIRILATSPKDTSASSSLTIFKIPEQPAVITGSNFTCIGTETYTSNTSQQLNTFYTWNLSGGGTLDTSNNIAKILWTSPGVYNLQITPSNACGKGPPRTLQVTVFNTAPVIAPKVTTNGRWLYASSAGASDMVTGFQWYKDNVAITGATSMSYYASSNGSFAVRYTNPCEAGPMSNAIVFSGDKQTQSITFTPVPDKTYGENFIILSASASSLLPVTFSVVSGPAIIHFDTLTITGAGIVQVRATHAGNDTFNVATADITFTVNKAVATVVLSELTQIYSGSLITPLASTNPSDLQVDLTFNGSSIVPVNAGSYVVEAKIINTNYTGFAKADLVIQKANQFITLQPLKDTVYGDFSIVIPVIASSKLPVSLSLVTYPEGIAVLSGNLLFIKGAGTVILFANQQGSNNYHAASTVSDTFLIVKALQQISLSDIPEKVVGDAAISLSAIASSGLAVSYRISTMPVTGVASLVGNIVSIIGPGTVTIIATQEGNQNYHPVELQKSFKIVPPKKIQAITFNTLSDKIFGDTAFLINATASSGLPVDFKIVSGPATISNNIVTITGAGLITIEATQNGGENYFPAPSLQRSFNVQKARQILTFEAIPDTTKGNSAYLLIASSSVGLPVSFSVSSGHASVTGNILSFTGAGKVIVKAYQPGNRNYRDTFVEKQFCIAPGQPSLIAGFTETCKSRQTYRVADIPGTSFIWSLSEGGNLLSNMGSVVSVDWTEFGSHVLTVTPVNPCSTEPMPSRTTTVLVTGDLVPLPAVNLHPNNDTLIQSFPFSVSWQPATGAQFYDLYIWPEGSPEATSPVVTGISQISYPLYQNIIPQFQAGKRYFWKVGAKNACKETGSAIKSFRVSDLPNLIVQSVEVPQSVFSGQSIEVVVEIKNNGKAGTKSSWTDAVYFSDNNDFDKSDDKLLYYKYNVSALGIGQSYRTTLPLTIPENIDGNYFLFIETNGISNALAELSRDDNFAAKELPVKLTPPPNLQVTSVLARGEAFSGQEFKVEWTTANKGTGDTKVGKWKDMVYISPDPIFDPLSAMKIGEITYNSGILKIDSFYTRELTVSLPVRIFGTHYIYVVTDADKQVLEFAFEEDNRGMSDSIIIRLTPPPDFVVSQLQNPAYATSTETIKVDWSVKNEGASKPHRSESTWTDAIYISKEPVLDRSKATLLQFQGPPQTQNGVPAMNPDEEYKSSAMIQLPDKLQGTWYLFVETDYYNTIFEYQKENNNVKSSRIDIVNPDMVLSEVSVPDSGSSGRLVAVEWHVSNRGKGKVLMTTRQDMIWLSPSPIYDRSKLIYLDEVSYNNSLDSGSAMTQQRSVKLPDTLFGTFYVFVETDYYNRIFEEDEINNRNISKAIRIKLSPWPDLKVSNVTVSTDTALAGRKFNIHYKVENKGTEFIMGRSWIDAIYISKEPQWNENRAFKLKDIDRNETLSPDASYEVDDSLELSMTFLRDRGIDSSKCYIYVFTDGGKNISEYRAENNNILSSSALYVLRLPYADLHVVDVKGSDSVLSGKKTTIEWSVKNLAGRTGYYSTYWLDGLYLSRDTVWDSRDIFLADQIIYGPVENNGIYKSSLSLNIPNGISGDFYLLLLADRFDYNADKNRADNAKAVHIVVNSPNGEPPVEVPATIHVTLSPSSDLAVTSFSVPSVGIAGQPLQMKWKIINQGASLTGKGGWTERIYLSTDYKIDNGDKILASYARKGDLVPGSSYEDSLDVFLPANSVGNYYILIRTDDNDVIYEHNAEQNNIASALLFVVQQAPADLIVTNISTPVQAMNGDTVTISWTVRNIGQHPATGHMQDGIYFSVDSFLNSDDVLLSDYAHYISLQPLEEKTYSAKVRLKGVSPDSNFVIVRTDLANNIYERDEENNVAVSSSRVSVTILDLPVNVKKDNRLENNDELYYKVDIADSLQGETLLISLQGDNTLGTSNQLFVKFGALPMRSNYDFAFSNAVSANQDIVIPVLQKGTYYILLYGSSKNAPQDISVLARKINFEIHTVQTNSGGNSGSVTVKISGAKFEDGMTVNLHDETLGTISAYSVIYKNSTTVFATFNLAGTAIGLYDLKLVKQNSQSATLTDGFTIAPGSGTGIAGGSNSSGFYCTIQNLGVDELFGVSVDVRDRQRFLLMFPMIINYGNSGNVNVPIPTLKLLSMTGSPMSFNAQDIMKLLRDKLFEQGLSELNLELNDPDGLGGILRPGAVGSKIIYAIGFNAGEILRFRLLQY